VLVNGRATRGGSEIQIDRTDVEAPVPLEGYTSTSRYSDFRFTSDGRLLIGAGLDGTVSIWDAVTGARLRSHPSPRANLMATELAISPDGTTILVGYLVKDGTGTGLLRVIRR